MGGVPFEGLPIEVIDEVVEYAYADHPDVSFELTTTGDENPEHGANTGEEKKGTPFFRWYDDRPGWREQPGREQALDPVNFEDVDDGAQ